MICICVQEGLKVLHASIFYGLTALMSIDLFNIGFRCTSPYAGTFRGFAPCPTLQKPYRNSGCGNLSYTPFQPDPILARKFLLGKITMVTY